MKKHLAVSVLFVLILAVSACVNRIAPFSPHRTNTEAHQKAQDNLACIGCHETTQLGRGHRATDDCLRCHRIVQGD